MKNKSPWHNNTMNIRKYRKNSSNITNFTNKFINKRNNNSWVTTSVRFLFSRKYSKYLQTEIRNNWYFQKYRIFYNITSKIKHMQLFPRATSLQLLNKRNKVVIYIGYNTCKYLYKNTPVICSEYIYEYSGHVGNIKHFVF